jgi:exopolyphosphatase/guanosine-5'-triphosphate,3'-diphosphate pyrophosphatase
MNQEVELLNHTPRLKIALIELGTNSVKLLIAGISTGQDYEVLHLSRVTTRLGAGLETSGSIDPAQMTRTLETIGVFQRVTANFECHKTFTFSTHVLRTAVNAPAVLRAIKDRTGLQVEVLSGRQEAQFAYLCAKNRLRLTKPYTLLMDIGGGSTEFVFAHNGRIEGLQSLPLGALHLTSLYLPGDPIRRDEFRTLKTHIDHRLMEAGRVILHPQISPLDIDLIASGGTASTLGRMIAAGSDRDYDPADPPQLKRRALAELLKSCVSLPLEQRKTLAGLDPDRADIIVAGLTVILRTMIKTNKRVLRTNEGGVREGVLQAIIQNGLRWPEGTTSKGTD